jgi:hypothetical protein
VSFRLCRPASTSPKQALPVGPPTVAAPKDFVPVAVMPDVVDFSTRTEPSPVFSP